MVVTVVNDVLPRACKLCCDKIDTVVKHTFHDAQACREPSNAANGSLNSSLIHRKREIWSCNFLLTDCFKDSNNQAFTVD